MQNSETLRAFQGHWYRKGATTTKEAGRIMVFILGAQKIAGKGTIATTYCKGQTAQVLEG
jgi:hypothetical protein